MLHNFFTNPALLIPSLLFPLFFFTAFAGGLSRHLATCPGFDFPDGYTAFQFVFVLLQSAAFGGVFTGFGIARDFEGGFARRLLLAAPHRSGDRARLRASPRSCRWLVTATVLTVVALAVGMKVGGGGVDLVGLYALGADRQRRRAALGGGRRDAPAHDAGRAADADARSSWSSSSRRSTCRCALLDGLDPRRRRRPTR